MRPSADSERLLDEVLDESTDFRGQSLRGLLQEARRHQQRRQRLRGALVAMAVAGLAWVGVTAVLRNPLGPGPESLAPQRPIPLPGSSFLVRSAPLAASTLIETSPASVAVVRSTPSSIPQMETPRDTAFFREISDGELFTLLGGRPAALVRLQSGRAELLLLDQ